MNEGKHDIITDTAGNNISSDPNLSDEEEVKGGGSSDTDKYTSASFRLLATGTAMKQRPLTTMLPLTNIYTASPTAEIYQDDEDDDEDKVTDDFDTNIMHQSTIALDIRFNEKTIPQRYRNSLLYVNPLDESTQNPHLSYSCDP